MNPEQTSAPSRRDHALLRHVLMRLTATPKILCVLLVAGVALAWYDLLNRLLAFGNGIDYAGNRLMGAEATALLQRYNPYFWVALVLLCTLLIAYLLSLMVRAILARARLKLVDPTSVDHLTEQLSAPALQVLLWAWPAGDEPLRVGDLQLTRAELRAGRAARLQLAARQRTALEKACQSRERLAKSDEM